MCHRTHQYAWIPRTNPPIHFRIRLNNQTSSLLAQFCDLDEWFSFAFSKLQRRTINLNLRMSGSWWTSMAKKYNLRGSRWKKSSAAAVVDCDVCWYATYMDLGSISEWSLSEKGTFVNRDYPLLQWLDNTQYIVYIAPCTYIWCIYMTYIYIYMYIIYL